MGKVRLKNIRLYAYHGCLPEESIIGSDYRLDVTIHSNLKKASLSDTLSDTVDYVHLNHIIKEEMNIPSKLLEHVGKRIINRIFLEINTVEKVKISVSKINPPIGGDVEMVSILLNSKR